MPIDARAKVHYKIYNHVHRIQDTHLRHHAMQREAMESVLERTPSGTLRWSSAHTPRILQSTSRDDTVPGPDQGRSRWPESIRPQLDRTSQCRQPTPPSNTQRFDSPLRRKPRSRSQRYCASTIPVRQMPPLRTRFSQEAKIDSQNRRSNRRRSRRSDPGPRPQRSPQPLWIRLTSIAVASVRCHCEGSRSWEARTSSLVLSGPWWERGRTPM